MNLTEKEILTILQNAHSVPLGSPMFESGEEYDKLVKIIESAIKFQDMKNAWEKDLYKEVLCLVELFGFHLPFLHNM